MFKVIKIIQKFIDIFSHNLDILSLLRHETDMI